MASIICGRKHVECYAKDCALAHTIIAIKNSGILKDAIAGQIVTI